MENSLAKTERTYIKLIVGGAGAIVLFIFLSWAAFQAYQRWEVRHLVRRSAAYLSGGDAKTASLNARRAFQINPKSADAARMIAQIAERSGDRTELDWRRKVLDLGATSKDDALALVRAALRVRDLATAEKTLNGLDAQAKTSPEYHAAMGRLAEMRNNRADAEAHWAKAAELAHDDSSYEMQLALIRMATGDPAKRESAHAVLDRLRADPKQRVAATRALIIDGATQHVEAQRMRALANELQGYSEAVFSDRLLYLEILRQMHDPGLVDYLEKLQKDASSKPADLASLISWMSGNEKGAEALQLTGSLPADSLAKWPVPLALAETYSKMKDWTGLERLTRKSTWVPYDFIRRAYLARALRGLDKRIAADQEWTAAQKEVSNQPQALLMLTRTVSAWDWRDETVELLWNLSKAPETRMEALQELYQHYAKLEDTSGLYRVLVRSLEIIPDDPMIQNNLAQISLLLDADSDRARKLAAELNKREPANPAYVSTYAFSLFTKGDLKGALKAMDGLSEEQRRDPAIATYYGIILAAAGDKDRARDYLKRGEGARLLPEEKSLLAKAENILR